MLCPTADWKYMDCGKMSVRRGRSPPNFICTNVFEGKSWLKEAKPSNVVVPGPKPRALLPLGKRTPPCKLMIDPVRKLENIPRFKASVVSPTPPYHTWFSS